MEVDRLEDVQDTSALAVQRDTVEALVKALCSFVQDQEMAWLGEYDRQNNMNQPHWVVVLDDSRWVLESETLASEENVESR